MNPNNYTSLEASRHLVEAGIVLETDFVYHYFWEPDNKWILVSVGEILEGDIPAPSMSELWRELPEMCGGGELHFAKDSRQHYAFYGPIMFPYGKQSSTNPCDALAELLIWIEGRKGNGQTI